ncbi:hypothetical protein H3146_28225, partial [Streptomyces sp. OF3]
MHDLPRPLRPTTAATTATRGRLRVERRGLALRFALLIGDPRLSAAQHAECVLDTVRVDFPETRVTAHLTRLTAGPGGELLVEFAAAYLTAGTWRPRLGWQRVLTGRVGALHQREALVRETLAARGCAPGRTVI